MSKGGRNKMDLLIKTKHAISDIFLGEELLNLDSDNMIRIATDKLYVERSKRNRVVTEAIHPLIVVYKDGSYKLCNKLDANYLENDGDWLTTIDIN